MATEKKKPITSGASSGHITKLEQSIFRLSISMLRTYYPESGIIGPMASAANGKTIKMVKVAFA